MTADPVCPAHPERPAVAGCADCGRWVCAGCRRITDDGLTRCPRCAGDEPEADATDARAPTDEAAPPPGPHARPAAPPPTGLTMPRAAEPPPPRAAEPVVQVVGPTPVAWERPSRHDDLRAFALTAREALLGPTRYMGRIPWVRGDLRTPLIFAVLAGVIGQLGLIAMTRFAGPPAGMSTAAGGFATLPIGGALATAPLLPLMVTVSVLVGGWLAHTMLRLAGDPPRPFEATFRVYAYAEVSSLLLWLPWLGPYAARFAYVFLLLTGLRLAQGAGFSASLLAMAPSVVLMWVLV